MRDIEELRPLRALTLLTIRQSLADTEEVQRGLLGNAEVLAQACFSQGQRVFPDARAVLEELTVGQMDSEAVLYMRQRGLSEVQARRLQIEGFVGDVVRRCGVEPLCETMMEAVRAKMEKL